MKFFVYINIYSSLFSRLLLFLLFSFILISCTADDLVIKSPYALSEISDPNETQNRLVVEKQLDLTISNGPNFSNWYSNSFSSYPKERLRDFIQNLKEPLNFVTSLLQLKIEKSLRAIMRFSINSTFGFLGFIDIMKYAGLQPANEDFGQVLAIWGVRQGDFIIIPTGQPSTSRDFLGSLLNLTLNPGIILGSVVSPLFYTLTLTTPLDLMDSYATNSGILTGLFKSSLDPYTTLKDTYIRFRRQEILESNPYDLYNLGN